MDEEQAQHNFEEASKLLSTINLSDLLGVSSQLSCLDYYSGFEGGFSVLFPFLNFERMGMLSKAILRSGSREYRQRPFDPRILPELWNLLSNSTYFDVYTDEDISGEMKLLKFMAKIGNAQFPYQQYNVRKDLARAYVLYHILPAEYDSELEKKHGKNYINIPDAFESSTGLSIREYLVTSFTLFAFYLMQYGNCLKVPGELMDKLNQELPEHSNRLEILIRLLMGFIHYKGPVRFQSFFNKATLDIEGVGILNSRTIGNYLHLVSKSIKELQDLQYDVPYSKGSISIRISPLERYPVVSLDNNRYIIPNMRYFDSSILNIIHFHLQEAYPQNQFNDTFGSVFEEYPKLVFRERLPDLTLIPEQAYTKKTQFLGPDITVIDDDDNYLIAVEVKSKKISLDTRLAPMSKSFEKDLDRIYTALKKLPDKVTDLKAGLPEYSRWQNHIDAIPKENIICVIVLYGSLVFLPEIVNQFRLVEPDHFLNKFPYKYCVIGIDILEHAIELAHHGKGTLGSLLSEYYATSRKLGPKESAAEMFGNISIDSEDYFLKKYIDMLVDDSGIKQKFIV